MSAVSVVISTDLFKQIRTQFPELYNRFLRAVGNRLRKELPGMINDMFGRYKTGRLAASTRAYVGLQGVEIVIGEGVTDIKGHAYARDVFQGAAPHVMDQRIKGRSWPMVWDHSDVGGSSGIAMRVSHPGQRARDDIIAAIKQRVREVAQEEATVFALLGVAP